MRRTAPERHRWCVSLVAMRRRVGVAAATAISVIVLMMAACSSPDDTASPSTAPAASTAVSAAPSPATLSSPPSATVMSAPRPPTHASDAAICQTSQLQLRIGQPTGAVGTEGIPLVFTNIGHHDCTITGYPGVSYVASPHGPQIGPAATRYSGTDRTNGPGPVTLAPGGSATARALSLSTGLAPKCIPTRPAGLRVYPPDNDSPIFVPFTELETCTNTGVLRIRPVEAGNQS